MKIDVLKIFNQPGLLVSGFKLSISTSARAWPSTHRHFQTLDCQGPPLHRGKYGGPSCLATRRFTKASFTSIQDCQIFVCWKRFVFSFVTRTREQRVSTARPHHAGGIVFAPALGFHAQAAVSIGFLACRRIPVTYSCSQCRPVRWGRDAVVAATCTR